MAGYIGSEASFVSVAIIDIEGDLNVGVDATVEGDLTVGGATTVSGKLTIEDNLEVTGETATGTLVVGDGVAIDAILDEDDMVSDSDTAVPTQQSVKQYVDDSAKGGMFIGNNGIIGTGIDDIFRVFIPVIVLSFEGNLTLISTSSLESSGRNSPTLNPEVSIWTRAPTSPTFTPN